MTKKTAPKRTTARKTVKRTIPKSRSVSQNQSLIFRRIVIISACLVIVFGIGATLNHGKASQAVAGAQITRGLFNQTYIPLPTAAPNDPNAQAYTFNIYYGQTGESQFANAVRNIHQNPTHSYLISYLKKGVIYKYKVATILNGKEVNFTPVKTITNLLSM